MLDAVGGDGSASYSSPVPADVAASGVTSGSAAAATQQSPVAAAPSQTAGALASAQAATAEVQRLTDQRAAQADIDTARQLALVAQGALQASVENELRLSADTAHDAAQAIKATANDIQARAPDDQILNAAVSQAQQKVQAESPVQRATNEQAFQFTQAALAAQDASSQAAAAGTSQNASAAAPATPAILAAQGAEAKLVGQLQHEFNVQAATLRLNAAKADYAAWQKEPAGARRSDAPDIADRLAHAQSQYDKVNGGDDNALTDLTDDEQQRAVALVKAAHKDDWYIDTVDAVATRSALKRTVATLSPADPTLTPLEQQLAQSDPVTAALLKQSGQRIDAGDPTLTTQEQVLVRRNPTAVAIIKMTGVDVDPTHMTPEQKDELDQRGVLQYAIQHMDPNSDAHTRIANLTGAAASVRFEFTRQQVSQLMQDSAHNAGAALKVLNTNMNAALTEDESAQLWQLVGQPHFNATLIQNQIKSLITPPKPGATDLASMRAHADSTMNADKIGQWMQSILPDAPPEFAGIVLDTVRQSMNDHWYQSNSGNTLPEHGTQFYKGLSEAVELADQGQTADGAAIRREKDVASWLLDRKGNAQVMLAVLRGGSTSYGFNSIRNAVGDGAGATLSQELLSQMQGDKQLSAGYARDFQMMLKQGLDNAQGKQNKIAAKASYQTFQLDPGKALQSYFDDYKTQFDNQAHTFKAGSPRLSDFVGVGLAMQPDNPAQVPTDANDKASRGMLAQQIVSGKRDGGPSLYAQNAKAAGMIKTVTDRIHDVGGDNPVVSLVPIYNVSKDSGANASALFLVKGKSGKPADDRYVDDRGWQYKSLDDYQHNNGLADDSKLYVPKGLTLDHGASGPAQYESVTAHITTGWQRVQGVLEIGTGILAAIGGVALMASGFGAPIGGAFVAGAWTAVGAGMAVGMGAGIEDLANLKAHGQSLSWSNAQARADWIGVIGSGLGAAGGGVGLFTQSFARVANMWRAFDEASVILGSGARNADAVAAFASVADTGAKGQQAISVVGALAGFDLTAEQGSSLLRNWSAMSDSDRMRALFYTGLGIAQLGAGSQKLMGRPIRALYGLSADAGAGSAGNFAQGRDSGQDGACPDVTRLNGAPASAAKDGQSRSRSVQDSDEPGQTGSPDPRPSGAKEGPGSRRPRPSRPPNRPDPKGPRGSARRGRGEGGPPLVGARAGDRPPLPGAFDQASADLESMALSVATLATFVRFHEVAPDGNDAGGFAAPPRRDRTPRASAGDGVPPDQPGSGSGADDSRGDSSDSAPTGDTGAAPNGGNASPASASAGGPGERGARDGFPSERGTDSQEGRQTGQGGGADFVEELTGTTGTLYVALNYGGRDVPIGGSEAAAEIMDAPVSEEQMELLREAVAYGRDNDLHQEWPEGLFADGTFVPERSAYAYGPDGLADEIIDSDAYPSIKAVVIEGTDWGERQFRYVADVIYRPVKVGQGATAVTYEPRIPVNPSELDAMVARYQRKRPVPGSDAVLDGAMAIRNSAGQLSIIVGNIDSDIRVRPQGLQALADIIGAPVHVHDGPWNGIVFNPSRERTSYTFVQSHMLSPESLPGQDAQGGLTKYTFPANSRVRMYRMSDYGYSPDAGFIFETADGLKVKPQGVDGYLVPNDDPHAEHKFQTLIEADPETMLPIGHDAVHPTKGILAVGMSKRGPIWPIADESGDEPPPGWDRDPEQEGSKPAVERSAESDQARRAEPDGEAPPEELSGTRGTLYVVSRDEAEIGGSESAATILNAPDLEEPLGGFGEAVDYGEDDELDQTWPDGLFADGTYKPEPLHYALGPESLADGILRLDAYPGITAVAIEGTDWTEPQFRYLADVLQRRVHVTRDGLATTYEARVQVDPRELDEMVAGYQRKQPVPGSDAVLDALVISRPGGGRAIVAGDIDSGVRVRPQGLQALANAIGARVYVHVDASNALVFHPTSEHEATTEPTASSEDNADEARGSSSGNGDDHPDNSETPTPLDPSPQTNRDSGAMSRRDAESQLPWPGPSGVDVLRLDGIRRNTPMFLLSVEVKAFESHARAISIRDKSLTKGEAQAIADYAQRPVYTHLDEQPIEPRKRIHLMGGDPDAFTFIDRIDARTEELKNETLPAGGIVVHPDGLPASERLWRRYLRKLANELQRPVALSYSDPMQGDQHVFYPDLVDPQAIIDGIADHAPAAEHTGAVPSGREIDQRGEWPVAREIRVFTPEEYAKLPVDPEYGWHCDPDTGLPVRASGAHVRAITVLKNGPLYPPASGSGDEPPPGWG